MAAITTWQTSFAAGEISPALYARTDLDKYKVGAARMRNFYVDYKGGANNRPGTRYIGTINETVKPRLIPFTYSTSETYVIVLGDSMAYFYSNGVFVVSMSAPWTGADLSTLKYAQSANVLTVTSLLYPPYNITRTSSVTFNISEAVSAATVLRPTSLAGTNSRHDHNDVAYSYVVTSVSLDGKEESLATFPITVPSDDPSHTDQFYEINTLTWTAPSGGASYYKVYKNGFINTRVRGGDATPINSIFGYIGQATGTSYSDDNINTNAPDFSHTPPVNQDPFSPGQIATVTVTGAGTGYSTGYIIPLIFTGGSGSGAEGYAILNPGTSTVISVVITNFGKNYVTVPTVTDANGTATYVATLGQLTGTYPACVTYFQQRRVFGGTTNFPESVVASQSGNYANFNTSAISAASDAITISIASTQNNTIRSMTSMPTGLVVFSTGNAFLVTGGSQNAAITPSTVIALPQASSGANDLPPLVVNYDVLYGQNRGAVVRDFAFSWQVQSYTGTDRSVLASHLFDNHLLTEWCYAEEPNRTVIALREDGVALCFTYVPEQEIYAWSQFDTNGLFTSTCSVIEDEENAVYFIVQRFVEDAWVYYLERYVQRRDCCVLDAWFVDCALALPSTSPDYPITVSGNTGEVTIIGSPGTGTTFAGWRTGFLEGNNPVPAFEDLPSSQGGASSKVVYLSDDFLGFPGAISQHSNSPSVLEESGMFLNYILPDDFIPGEDITFSVQARWVSSGVPPIRATMSAFIATADGGDIETASAFGSPGAQSLAAGTHNVSYQSVDVDLLPGGGNVATYTFTIPTVNTAGAYVLPEPWTDIDGNPRAWDGTNYPPSSPPPSYLINVNLAGHSYTLNGETGGLSGFAVGGYYGATAGSLITPTGDAPGSVSLAPGDHISLIVLMAVRGDGDPAQIAIYNYTLAIPGHSSGNTTLPSVGDVVAFDCGQAQITAITNPGVYTATVLSPFNITLPDDPDNTPVPISAGEWTLTTPVSTVSGLDHLEGKLVTGLADGEVIPPQRVDGGEITLSEPASSVIVGLGYQSQLQTLYLDVPTQQGSVQTKRKFVSTVDLRLECTRGIKVGTDFEHLVEMKDLAVPVSDPQALFTGDKRISIPSRTNDLFGQACIQQDNPLPVSVLGVALEVTLGDTGR